jgi:hypothetical protein
MNFFFEDNDADSLGLFDVEVGSLHVAAIT